MRMKRVLLATTALALFAGAQQAQAEDLYVSVFGGLNKVVDTSGAFTVCCGGTGVAFDSSSDTGFVLGGAIGTHLDKWVKGLRVEVEASYRRNDFHGNWITTTNGSTGGTIDGNMSTFAVMANAWYDIDIGNKVKPYICGGVGWARSHGDDIFHTTFTDGPRTTGTLYTGVAENSGFAYQLGVGINYEVMPDVDLGIGYRYFRGPDFQDVFFGNKAKFQNENHAVQVNLTIGIN